MRRCPLPSVVLLFPFLLSCGGDGGPTETEVDPVLTTITVTPDTTAVSSIGSTTRLEATARDQNGNVMTEVSFSWDSREPSVATVDGDGTVTATANGSAVIEASAAGVTGTAYLVVRAGSLIWSGVAAGPFNSCAVTTHGTVYCWGSNRHGQVADEGGSRAAPVKEESFLYFTNVWSSGQTCALTFGGDPYCWGSSAAGERGDGTTGDDPTPSAVSTTATFEQLTTGGNHTCGVSTDSESFCWGLNSLGQLGDGTTTDRTTPVRVEGGLAFRQVSAGRAPIENHTCGITTDGGAYCWGPNADGELGDGTTTGRLVPVPVQGDLDVDWVSSGGGHTCAVTTDGTAYCWGANGNGQLGDGTTTGSTAPVAVSTAERFQEISAGNHHTCGLTTDGRVLCWGSNASGQLGDGGGGSGMMPVEVAGGHTYARLHAGNNHTCALTVEGGVHCWGANDDGQLGDGSFVDRGEPTPVPDPEETG